MTDGFRFTELPEGQRIARKGGKGGGGGAQPYKPVEYPNTLRSRSLARIMEVISEGVIQGMHTYHYDRGDPWDYFWQSIILDGTPVWTGSYNYNIWEAYFRQGTPYQDPVPGFPMAETEVVVGVECKPMDPVVRRLSSTSVNAVRVTIRIPQLFMTETDGDINGTSTAIEIDYQIDGGGWIYGYSETIFGKTMSPYERSYRIDFAYQAASSIDIRVIRTWLTTEQGTANAVFWSSYTEIQDGQLSYDDTALMAVTIDAEDFPNIPQRAYLVDGIRLQVPSNYDPWRNEYAGPWDGSFKIDWTNNPAWILYGLLTNERWGLGRYLDVNAIDKWSFYEAAFYNDGNVPDGKGGSGPRWTCNCVINTRQDAWQILTAVASSMCATLYFASGTVFCVQDRGGLSGTRLFGPADVVNGVFEYTGTDFRSRYTACAVTWNDPEDAYKPAVELVQDATLVAQQGYKEQQVSAFGCTNKGQAIRLGRYLIYTSQYETEVVSFQTGLENADIRPGELIAINDPGRAGARLAGRLLHDPDPNIVTLDQQPGILSTQGGFTIYFQIGSVAEGQKPGIVACPVVTGLGNNRVQITGKPAGAVAGTMWLLTNSNVLPTWWRVAVVTDASGGKYQILGTQWDVNKHYYIDNGWYIPEPPHSLIPSGPIVPPTDITVVDFIYLDASGRPQFGVIMSWTASRDPRVTRYQLEFSGPDSDYRLWPTVAGISQEALALRQGQWEVRLRAFDSLGRYSVPVGVLFTPTGLSARPLCPEALYITPQGGNMITLTWTPTGEIDVVFYWIKFTGITGGATWENATTSIARVDRNTTQINTPARYGTYLLKAIDSLGQESVDWVEAVMEPQQTERSIVLDWHEEPTWAGDLGAVWHHNAAELWMPPPVAPEAVPPGVFPGDRGLVMNQTPTRVGVYGFASRTPDTVFDFTAASLPAGATLTRASTGWYFNSTPALASAATNVARFDYTGLGAYRGLLNEPAATNFIRNSTASGAVAGTPGTQPTNWSITSTANSVTRTIVGTGSEDGIPYMDIRYAGTPTASGNLIFISPEGGTVIPAASGQTWTASSYYRLMAGSTANLSSIVLRVAENNAAGGALGVGTVSLTPTGSALRAQRYTMSRPFNQPLTAFAALSTTIAYTSGLPIDITLRIGLPQLELANAVSSPIVTTTAAITRAAEVLTLAAPVADTYDVTILRESGSTTVPSVVVSTSYVVPVDPSPVQQVTLSPSFKGLDLGGSTLVTMSGYVEGYGDYISEEFMATWTPIASQAPLAQAGTTAQYMMSTWEPLASAVPLAIGTSPNWDAHIDARVSVDGSTWLDWFPLKSTVITAQKFEWRMVGALYDLATTLRAHQARVVVEVPLRNVQGSDVLIDGTGHLVVTYVSPFLQTPTVQITARQSLAPGGAIVITESDSSHFKLEHRNSSGAATTGGSVDYFVQGYGGHA